MKEAFKVMLAMSLIFCFGLKEAKAVTADNFLETYTLLASDASDGNVFGASVSMNDNLVVAGALEGEKAYIYSFIAGELTELAIVTEGSHPNSYGSSVSAGDNTVAVGARNEGSDSQGVTYVYTVTNGSVSSPVTLTANDAQSGDSFGSEVALQGNILLVGAPSADISGNENSGAAYVFNLVNGTWQQSAKLVPSDPGTFFYFGVSLAISNDGTTIVIGSPGNFENPSETEITGAVYVFNLVNGTWTQTAKLVPSNAANDDFFGYDVAIDDGIIAGASPFGNSDTGSVTLFNLPENGTWTQGQTLTASDASAFDLFGYSIALNEGVLSISAPEDMNTPDSPGAVYLFALQDSTWTQSQDKLVPVAGQISDIFGYSIALDNFILLVGAPGTSNVGPFQGAVFFYTQAAVIADPEELDLDVSAQGTYTLVLNSEPANDVVVTPVNSNFVINPSSLTFTIANWATPQTITITAPDTISEADFETFTISHTVTSVDTLFNIDGPEVLVTVAASGAEPDIRGGRCSLEPQGGKPSHSWMYLLMFVSAFYVSARRQSLRKGADK